MMSRNQPGLSQEYYSFTKALQFYFICTGNYSRKGVILLILGFQNLNQQFQRMRTRFFSPELRQTMEIYKSKEHSKLRWVGSQVRLTGPIGIQQCHEQTIGGYSYHSNKQIGSGYSSKVYKARKINDATDYAVKVIDLKKYSSTNMEMLSNQIQILKSLNHPNVLKCYDIFKTSTQCFIITEFCGNGDLLNHLAKKGRFNQKQTVQIISDLISGYKYLCEQSIIHRDLKPANILRSANKWKIADFGFAIRSFNSSQVRTKYNVGTPLYMPPEALIQNLYSVKSDIFSIGVIMYEMLVGCTPWESRTEKDLIKKMGAVPFRIPEKYQISSQLKAVLESMCEVRLKKRMDKKQLISLNILNLMPSSQNPEQQPFQLRKQKSLDYLRDRLNLKTQIKPNPPHLNFQLHVQAPQKQASLLSSKSIMDAQEDAEIRKKQSQNNEILICQLHYCRFLYYLVRNIGCVILERKTNQKLGVIVFTHLLRLAKLIGDGAVNYLNLKDWDKFKKSKKYLNTSLTIKQYCIRYDKEYSNYLKSVQLDVLEQVNSMFPQISKSNIFSIDFYSRILRFLSPTIKSLSAVLSSRLIQQQGELSKDEVGSIQALKSLYKYYRLLQMSVKHFQDYQYFETHCNIKVNVDFKKSSVNLDTYNDLRRQIKNI